MLQWIMDASGISVLHNAQGNLAIEEFMGAPTVTLKCMANFLKHNKLQKLKSELILTPENYRLLLMDSPQVPKEEIKLAVRWLIKDFVDYPPEQAAIDVFPITVKPGQAAKIYVVVSPLAELSTLVKEVRKADILLEKINITELVFAAAMSKAPKIQALLYSIGQRLRLLIVENQELRWLRDLDFEWTAQELSTAQLEILGFEVQRSFDYYQAEVSTTQPTQLKLAAELNQQKNLVAYLTQVIPLQVVPIIAMQTFSLRQLVANYLLAAQQGATHATN